MLHGNSVARVPCLTTWRIAVGEEGHEQRADGRRQARGREYRAASTVRDGRRTGGVWRSCTAMARSKEPRWTSSTSPRENGATSSPAPVRQSPLGCIREPAAVPGRSSHRETDLTTGATAVAYRAEGPTRRHPRAPLESRSRRGRPGPPPDRGTGVSRPLARSDGQPAALHDRQSAMVTGLGETRRSSCRRCASSGAWRARSPAR